MNRRLIVAPLIFGTGDGMVSLLGAVFYLSGHPALVLPAAVTSGATSAVSMAGFEWLSDDTDHGFGQSCLLGAATWAGCMLPAIPYAFTRGVAAIVASVLIVVAMGVAIALVRPNRGKVLSLAETGAVLAVAFAAVFICAAIFPGSAA